MNDEPEQPAQPTFRMSLVTLLSMYSDGDEHGWDIEFNYLRTNHHERLSQLRRQIQHDGGILTPIELGDDGRVWNGHHRLCIAYDDNHYDVPVTHAS